MVLIDGVKVKRLEVKPSESGRLMEIVRRDDDIFINFGQAYITTAYPGVVKGWGWHNHKDELITTLGGMVKAVLYDGRENSPTHGAINEFFMGDFNPCLLRVPPRVVHGFKCVSESEATLLIISSELYDRENPDEFHIDPHVNNIPYDWRRKDG